MPIHNWKRVPAGLFHHFHQHWSIEITTALNRGLLPPGTAALVEQRSGPLEPDVLAIETIDRDDDLKADIGGSVAIATPPQTRIVQRSESELYADRANRIVVRHRLGRIVAVIEIVSPGNKSTRHALNEFIEKTVEFLRVGIHVLIVDLFPPSLRDLAGIHQAIWDEIGDEKFQFPPGKNLTLVSYEAAVDRVAYLEPLAVGDAMPDMPIFLTRDLQPNRYVLVPLERTYLATWEATPNALRKVVETGVLPDPDAE